MALKLKKILEGRGRTFKEYSALLGISEKALYNKLSGSTEFTVREFQKIKTILPEYDVLYLMENDPETGRRKNDPVEERAGA